MLAVDPATGAMWNIAPDKIDRKLVSGQSALIKNKRADQRSRKLADRPESIILTTDDVP